MRASRQTFGGVVGLSIDWVLDVTFDVFVRFWQTLTLAHSAPRPPLGTYAIFRDFLFEEFKVDIGTIQGWKVGSILARLRIVADGMSRDSNSSFGKESNAEPWTPAGQNGNFTPRWSYYIQAFRRV